MDPSKEKFSSLSSAELIRSLISAFQNSHFTQVEEEVASREGKMKKEIELLTEKLEREVLEKISAQRECAELKQENSRLREEQEHFDEELMRIADDKQTIIELTEKIGVLKSENSKLKAEVGIYHKKLETMDLRILRLEKDSAVFQKKEPSASKSVKISGEALGEKAVNGNGEICEKPVEMKTEMDAPAEDDDHHSKASAGEKKMSENEGVESRLKVGGESNKLAINEGDAVDCLKKANFGTNAGLSGHTTNKNGTGKEKTLSETIIEILDSDDESAQCDISSSRKMESQRHIDKADSGQTAVKDEMGVHKRAQASFAEKCGNSSGEGKCTIGKYKRTKIEEHTPITSPVNHSSPTTSYLRANLSGKASTLSRLPLLIQRDHKSRGLIPDGVDSSSSSSSDSEEPDLEVDYPSLYKTPHPK